MYSYMYTPSQPLKPTPYVQKAQQQVEEKGAEGTEIEEEEEGGEQEKRGRQTKEVCMFLGRGTHSHTTMGTGWGMELGQRHRHMLRRHTHTQTHTHTHTHMTPRGPMRLDGTMLQEHLSSALTDLG